MSALDGRLPADVQIIPLDPDLAAARALLAASDRLMGELYPALSSQHLESALGLKQAEVLFLGAWVGAELAGCGAVRRRRDSAGQAYGEIKRVFVHAEQRGRGLARLLMLALEQDLMARGIALACLETGIRQPEALALYARLGYRQRGPFGEHEADATGVFMEKILF